MNHLAIEELYEINGGGGIPKEVVDFFKEVGKDILKEVVIEGAKAAFTSETKPFESKQPGFNRP